MGTPARIIVKNGNVWNPPLCCIVKTMDGYPSQLGKRLYLFLRDIEITDGISLGEKNVANGMGCLAAQLVAHFKDGPGSVYLYPHYSDQMRWNYEIYLNSEKNNRVSMRILDDYNRVVVWRHITDFTETMFKKMENQQENA